MKAGTDLVLDLTRELSTREPDAMLLHSSDYLELFSTLAVAWQWLDMAAVARGLPEPSSPFATGKLRAAQYWIETELPRIAHLAHLCRSGEDSYATMPADAF